MSAFERAWLFLKQGGLPDLLGDDDDKPPQLPDIFDSRGNLAADAPKAAQKVSAQPDTQMSAPAISAIGAGPQLAILGHRGWGMMHDEEYPKEALYEDMERFDDKMQEWIDIHGPPSHIISGGYGGTDDLAQQWAEDNKIPLTVHAPNFKEDGRWDAIPQRNNRIADSASHFMLFHHPMGSATQDAWQKANARGKPVHTHSILGDPNEPIRDAKPAEKEKLPHWYREFIGDMGAKILPENSKKRVAVGDKDRLAAAMRRVHGKEFAQGRMRTQSKTDREHRTSSGTTEGFPMRAPFTSASGRHIPKDTRTDEEKQYDRLIEMARESGSGINIEPREGGGRSKEDQLEEIRERKRLSNEEATQQRAMGNLPIPRGPASPDSAHHEAQMHEDMAAAQEGRPAKRLTRKVPAHRGTRGGRSREDTQFADDMEDSDAVDSEQDDEIHEEELVRRLRYNADEDRKARQLGRAPDPLPLLDEDGNLTDLDDPHFIDDLRFKKMLTGLTPIDAAFAVIKGFSYAR